MCSTIRVIVVFFFAMYEKQTDKTFTKMCAENDFFYIFVPSNLHLFFSLLALEVQSQEERNKYGLSVVGSGKFYSFINCFFAMSYGAGRHMTSLVLNSNHLHAVSKISPYICEKSRMFHTNADDFSN